MTVSIGKSFAVNGIDAYPVTVEVDIRKGLPTYSTVGLPDKAVIESQNRVNAAIKNAGYSFPVKKITVNLAPADIKKEGSLFDFPIAIGILTAAGLIKQEVLNDIICVGELSLNGDLRKVFGILPIVKKLKDYKFNKILVPTENAQEAAIIKDIDVIAIKDLKEAVEYLNGIKELKRFEFDIEKHFKISRDYELDFSYIKGQYFAKRSLEIAASGRHNILMVGPPGAGKTMLAKSLVTILPPLTLEEALEVTVIQSVTGNLPSSDPIYSTRPFRSPHNTISDVAMVGGGTIPKPGEISLAHRGVLFLDEFSQFPRQVIQVLRQLLEDGKITVSRAADTITFPAHFMLVAAMNPCPCGFRDVEDKECSCSSGEIRKYLSKISGPILDRIDLHIQVPQLKRRELSKMGKGEQSERIRERVINAMNIQIERFKGQNIFCNADINSKNLEKHCKMTEDAQKLIDEAIDIYGMSARGYDKLLRISRTIADLEKKEIIDIDSMSEALQYRFMEGVL